MSDRTEPGSPAETVSPAEDRDRQISAASWILGWIGGPLPAVAMLAVVDSPPWSRRLIVAAAVFWTAMWTTWALLFWFGVRGDVGAFGWLWLAAGLVAIIATLMGARLSYRASARRPVRRRW